MMRATSFMNMKHRMNMHREQHISYLEIEDIRDGICMYFLWATINIIINPLNIFLF